MAITKFIPQIWSAALLEHFKSGQYVIPTLNRQYEGDARKGNVVKVTAITTPTVQDYAAAGRTLTIDALADTQQDILIDQEKAIAFKVDDIDRVQAAGSFEPVTRDAGHALAEDAEQFAIAQMLAGGTSAGTTAPTDFDSAFAVVSTLRENLTKAKVPSASRFLVVNPEFASLLLSGEGKLTSVDAAGSAGELRNGVIGRLLGFTVIEHPGFDEDAPSAIGYHGPSAAFISQIDKVEAGRMELSFADYIRALNVYGGKVLRSTAVQTWIGAPAAGGGDDEGTGGGE